MKKILTLITVILLVGACIYAKTMPERPNGVPKEAKWDYKFNNWFIDGEFLGDSKMWYIDGTIMVDNVKVDNTHLKEINYDKDGKIRSIGQYILLKNTGEEGGPRYVWCAYGKWKYYENNKLIRELCNTQRFDDSDGVWVAEECNEEILYKNDGSVKEKIKHKNACKFGCEELECKDCFKK